MELGSDPFVSRYTLLMQIVDTHTQYGMIACSGLCVLIDIDS